MRADMLVDHKVPAAANQELVSALTALGVTAHARVLPLRRGAENVGWLILIAVPLQAFLSPSASARRRTRGPACVGRCVA